LNLKYVDDKGMACTACNEFGEPNGMFITGCTSYKVDSLTKHEKPKQHEKRALVTKAKLKGLMSTYSATQYPTTCMIMLNQIFNNSPL
jgi:hypothetical protein